MIKETLFYPTKLPGSVAGKHIVWGQLSQRIFTSLANKKLEVRLSDKGTQIIPAEQFVGIQRSEAQKALNLSVKSFERLWTTLAILAEMESYSLEAFDTSILETEVQEALTDKWVFYGKGIGQPMNLHFLDSVTELAVKIEEVLKRSVIVNAGSSRYFNARELAYISPRFVESSLLTEDFLDLLRDLLLNLSTVQNQVDIHEMRTYVQQMNDWNGQAKRDIQLVNLRWIDQIKGDVYTELAHVKNDLERIPSQKLKLIHAWVVVSKHTDRYENAKDEVIKAISAEMLFQMCFVVEQLLGVTE